jgi:hypothetical protein
MRGEKTMRNSSRAASSLRASHAPIGPLQGNKTKERRI